MPTQSIYADFNNADQQGRLRLNCVGTIRDLGRLGLQLQNGLGVLVHDEELEADALVGYSSDEHIWVATIDWDAIRQFAGSAAEHL